MAQGKDLNPGSLTGVWAPQNTREAIWDGLKARETFATSGPRIKVRFFGRLGAGTAPADAKSLVESGYARGVPMGGTLQGGSGVPSFTVWAMKRLIDRYGEVGHCSEPRIQSSTGGAARNHPAVRG